MQDLILPDFLIADPSQRYIVEYLYRLVEQLEFILNNISEDNFSDALTAQLKALGAEIKTSAVTSNEAQQKANKQISVSDVLNSPLFTAAQDAQFSSQLFKDKTEAERVAHKADTINDVLTSEAFANAQSGQFTQSDGQLIIQGDTAILYGSAAESVTFPITYAAIPIVVTSPSLALTVTTQGMSCDESTSFNYIVIGRRASDGTT